MTDGTFTSPGQVAILVTAITSLIVTLATLVYNYKREGRRQEWERERREWEAGAAERHRQSEAAARLEREELARKVDENTEISKQAFEASNNFNLKLAANSDAYDQMLERLFSADVDREARLAAAAVVAASKLADVTASNAADVAAKVVTANEALAEVAADTTDTRAKVTEIRDKVVGDGG